jgi:Mlc titration factor MtfA (ptsG expression regulator)
MEILLSLLIEWLQLNTDISIKNAPKVVIVSDQELQKRYGKPAHALYQHQEKIIYLSQNINLTTLQGASVLLHELVHHYQNISGAMDGYSCIRASERLAYETQRHYLNANKAQLIPELDDFNIVMHSFCEEIP